MDKLKALENQQADIKYQMQHDVMRLILISFAMDVLKEKDLDGMMLSGWVDRILEATGCKSPGS